MERVINGKIYDTDKATVICSYSVRDGFKSEDTSLYITKNNRFFLQGSGGPMTRWAQRHSGNTRSEGSGILAINKDDALLFAEDNADIIEIKKYFKITNA